MSGVGSSVGGAGTIGAGPFVRSISEGALSSSSTAGGWRSKSSRLPLLMRYPSSSLASLLGVAVLDHRVVTFAAQERRQLLGHHHRAVTAAGAADGDGQVSLAF